MSEQQVFVEGTLRHGIVFDNVRHKKFTIRPEYVYDSLDAIKDPRASDNEVAFALAVIARQLIKLGEIPRENINADLLSRLTAADLRILRTAREEAERKLDTFCANDPARQDTGDA